MINKVLTDNFLKQNEVSGKFFSFEVSTVPTFNDKSSQSSLKRPLSKKVNEIKINRKNKRKSQCFVSGESSNYEPS